MAHAVSLPRRPRRIAPLAPGLPRRLRRWLVRTLAELRPACAASAAACDAERYRKHFTAFQHLGLLAFHGLTASPSLRTSYAQFADSPALVALCGLADAADPAGAGLAVSYSHLAASNTSRPAAFLGGLLPALLARAGARAPRSVEAVLRHVLVLDSTFLRLSFHLAAWLPPIQRPTSSGVRVQLQYRPAFDLPEHAVITTVRTNDCQGLDLAVLDDPARRAALRGQTLIFDLGYYRHRRFGRLRAADLHFVTRLHPQAAVTVVADTPVQAALPGLDTARITIHTDQRVTLGSPNNRAGDRQPGLRLVVATVAPLPKAARRGARPQEYRLVTDRHDLPAAAVVLLYLWRWQIELFLRWLKSHVHLPRLLGASENAVALTLWLAILVHLLCLLAAADLALGQRSPTLLRALAWALTHLTPADCVSAPAARQLPLPTFGLPPPPT